MEREGKRKSELPSKEDPYRYGSPETASKRQECKYNKWRIQLVQDCANNKNYAQRATDDARTTPCAATEKNQQIRGFLRE
jgi:hypothetical protein